MTGKTTRPRCQWVEYDRRGTTRRTIHLWRWYQCNRKAVRRGLCRKHNRVIDGAEAEVEEVKKTLPPWC